MTDTEMSFSADQQLLPLYFDEPLLLRACPVKTSLTSRSDSDQGFFLFHSNPCGLVLQVPEDGVCEQPDAVPESEALLNMWGRRNLVFKIKFQIQSLKYTHAQKTHFKCYVLLNEQTDDNFNNLKDIKVTI